MYLAIFILTRVLFVVGMIFIIGYVFGSFSKNRTLTWITKISTILILVLFILTGVFFARSGGRFHGPDHHVGLTCPFGSQDPELN